MQEVNPKTAWWREHKNDPTIIACMKEARRKYYYKNQEREQQRGREYYYMRKALLHTMPPIMPLADPMPPASEII